VERDRPGRYADPSLTDLEREAARWLDGFYELEHLLATRQWVLRLRPHATAELRFAALVHDAERFFPGGPGGTPRGFDDPDYLFAHSIRSADVVEKWLRERVADEEFIRTVRALVLRHEVGGGTEADVLQAADSLSFLDTLDWLAAEWVATGRYTAGEARQKLRWMLERIRPPEAAALALPYYERAARDLDRGDPPDPRRRQTAGDLHFLCGLAGNRPERTQP
jgi:hypothetical protein